jgi:hypothetical protein
VRIAFQNLLSDAGRPRGFTVLAEQTLSLAGKRTIRVDSEVRDPFRIRHGIWEAKDSGDDLENVIPDIPDQLTQRGSQVFPPLPTASCRMARSRVP